MGSIPKIYSKDAKAQSIRSFAPTVASSLGATVLCRWRTFAPKSDLNYFIWECFRRLPTTPELARPRKYARRMRKFREFGSLAGLVPEMLLVLRRSNLNEPSLPNLEIFELFSTTAEFVPFIPLFIFPGTTDIDITFTTRGLSKALVASTINTISARCPNLQHRSPLPTKKSGNHQRRF